MINDNEPLKTLSEFERIIILKTILFDIDTRLLDEADLNRVANYAEDMEIDIDLEEYYKLNYPTVQELTTVLNNWKNEVYEKYESIKNILIEHYIIGEDY